MEGVILADARPCGQAPHPCNGSEREQIQIVGRDGADFLGIGHALHRHLHGDAIEQLERFRERLGEFLQRGVFPVLLEESPDLRSKRTVHAPVVDRQFPAHKVERLDVIGPLINHRDAGIAEELLDAPIAGVAAAAEHLQAVADVFKSALGQVAFYDRRHQRHHVRRVGLHGRIGMMKAQVQLLRGPIGQRAHAFGGRFAIEQHAAHIRVNEDEVRPRRRVAFGRIQRPALTTFLREHQRVLVGDLAHAKTLQSHLEPGSVHKGKHGLHALVRQAHEPPFRALEIDDARRRRMNPHLVLEATAKDGVTRTVQEEFWDDEQADTLDARRRIGQAREHEMNDVFGKIVLAKADPNLGARELPVIAMHFRLRRAQPEIRAALRFGQAHRAAPFAGHELGHVLLFQRLAGVAVNRMHRALAQPGAHGERLVARNLELVEHRADHGRRALATELDRLRDSHDPLSVELLVELLEALRGRDGFLFRIVLEALEIRARVQRQHLIRAEFRGLGEDRHGRLEVEILVRVQRRDLARIVEHLFEEEADFLEGSFVDGHNGTGVGENRRNAVAKRIRARCRASRRGAALRMTKSE